MAGKTNIEWATDTWNPIVGCSVQSKGCTNCYAMKMAARIEAMQRATYDNWLEDALNIGRPEGSSFEEFDSPYKGTTKKVNGNTVWTGKVNLASDQAFFKPLNWTKPRRIFVNSMGDLFHENVPTEWIDKVFTIMALCPQHTFIILTKNPKRMREYIAQGEDRVHDFISEIPYEYPFLVSNVTKIGGFFSEAETDEYPYQIVNRAYCQLENLKWPLQNVWLGVSVENQAAANERIPHLLETPAAVRFISAEPLLGEVDLSRFIAKKPFYMTKCEHCGWISSSENCGGINDDDCICPNCFKDICGNDYQSLNWVIVGGESGKNARPMHPDWVLQIRDDCKAANVPFFFKQWGEWACGSAQLSKKPNGEEIIFMNDGRLARSYNEIVEMDKTKPTSPYAPHYMTKVGKKLAGNELKGRQYLNYPKSESEET